MDHLIDRPTYLSKLSRWRDNGLIKVIMGPRRCGKSVLMELFQRHLIETGVARPEDIISFHLDRDIELKYCDKETLHSEIVARCSDDRHHYLFIDEVQQCPGFEKLLDSILWRKNLDIYVTGSNAYMLSGELATYLTGRYLPLEMLPLSFAEFRSATEKEGLTLQTDFHRYMHVGSYPAIVSRLSESDYCKNYYQTLLSNVIYKDIVPRYKIREPQVLDRLITTMASSLGSALSIRRIADTLKSAGNSAHPETIGTYVKALEDSYLYLKAQRFDIRGREALRSQEKYYLCDTGFRDFLFGSPALDTGHLLENIVYLELRRRYPYVYIGKAGDQEIDFVVRDRNLFAYIQVSSSVLISEVLERELAPFSKIKDKYPCYLMTLDEIGADRSLAGIKQLNVLSWMLNPEEQLLQ